MKNKFVTFALLTTVILYTSYFAISQGTNIVEKKGENELQTFKNQGEYENFLTKKFYNEHYIKQNYNRFEGEICIVNDSIIKYGEEILEIKYISNELKTIFEIGIIYPEIIFGTKTSNINESEETLTNFFYYKNNIITDFEEVVFLNNTPFEKKFKFWLFIKGIAPHPTVYLLELTNENATEDTDIVTFIKNSKLTFFKKGWLVR
jgi:hypothetical protein